MTRHVTRHWRTALVAAFLCAGPAAAQTQGGAAAAQAGRPTAGAEETQPVPAERNTILLPRILAELFGPGRGGRAAPSGVADGGAANGSPPSAVGGTIPVGAVPPPPAGPSQAISGAFVADEVLVTLDGGTGAASAIAGRFGLQLRSARVSNLLGRTVARFGIPDGRPVGFVLAQLAGEGRLAARVPNHVFELQQAPGIIGYAFERIALDAARASGANVSVAVIDTALDPEHPALAGAVTAQFDALPDTAVKDRGHGTSISGLIVGHGPFRGMAPGARLLHARAFEGGISSTDVLLSALDWAVEEGADIVNMSFVGPQNRLFAAACRNATARGVVLVAAAGNNGPGAPFGYPAAYDGVIAVTATDVHDRLMDKANRGRYVDLAAPGVNVMAPVLGGMDAVTGTSFAAAIVSGAIANLMSGGTGHDPQAVAGLLADTAVDLGQPGRDEDFGDGLVNAGAAMARR